MELLTKLGIDWKLLIAQMVNFFLLLLILYKFVYKPVFYVLDRRSKTIAQGLHDAKKSEEILAQVEKIKDEKITNAEREVGRIMDSARKDAENMKKEIIAVAASQAEELLKRARAQMQEEKNTMMSEIRSEVTDIIVQATGKILQKEFSESDQKRLLDAISHEMKV